MAHGIEYIFLSPGFWELDSMVTNPFKVCLINGVTSFSLNKIHVSPLFINYNYCKVFLITRHHDKCNVPERPIQEDILLLLHQLGWWLCFIRSKYLTLLNKDAGMLDGLLCLREKRSNNHRDLRPLNSPDKQDVRKLQKKLQKKLRQIESLEKLTRHLLPPEIAKASIHYPAFFIILIPP